jgi:perosamine synthetase
MSIDMLNRAYLVPQNLRVFPHPLYLQDFDYGALKALAVLDYNGGGVIDDLERAFADWNNRRHAVAFNSGTSALAAMFDLLSLKPGDEVIVPTYTFFATATPLIAQGATPVLADCAEDGNIDPQAIEAAITDRTRAIIVTHLWGRPCAMDEIARIANRHRLALLEDASHAHGATFNGKKVGTFGMAAAWSCGARKLLTGGQGGMLACDWRELYERAILFGHYNRRGQRDITLPELKPYATTGTGYNLRMHPYAAALLAAQMGGIERELAERRASEGLMRAGLEKLDFLEFSPVSNAIVPSGYAVAMRYKTERANGVSRDDFLRELAAQGAVEVDAPNTTCPLDQFALFQERARCEPSQSREARAYHAEVLKTPTWYGPHWEAYTDAYIKAFLSVADRLGALG